jgi:PAS domain S-box-containing protein
MSDQPIAQDKTIPAPATSGSVRPGTTVDSIHAINQQLFETSLDLILVVDRQGTFIRVSPSAKTILGRDAASMVGQSAVGYIHPDDLDSTRAEMRMARRGRQMRNFDCRYIHRNGSIVNLTWTGVWSPEVEQHFFIGRDMTERQATEEKLRHLQRLEAVGQLTGGIAHDFNNILAIVVGSLDLIAEQPGLDEEGRKYVGDALHAAESGAQLTRRLLAFARQQPLAPRVLDVNEQLQRLTPLLSRTLGQNIEIRFQPGPDLWPVFIDAANLESAIINLAVNARDAMPDGGRLIIETANAVLDAAYAEINPGCEAGDYVSVAITDTGIGIPAAVVGRIFEPFFTTKEMGKGSGLGLSMVFGFLKQSGGHIKVYSELGHGTTIRIYLPRAGAAAPGQTAPTAQPQLQMRPSHIILVVEDNEAIRALALQHLKKIGYQTLEAANAGEAMRYIDSGAPIDLLFTDIVMPGGMSGYDLAREARRRRPGLKVLFTSGFPGAVFPDTIDHDPDAMLSKPYRVQELALRLAALLT